MKICVYGLWHLGSVTSACLAGAGFHVVGLDSDSHTITRLKGGDPPVFEPGLEDLIKNGLNGGNLSFTSEKSEALKDTDLLWVTFDTPVNDNDEADVRKVTSEIQSVFRYLKNGSAVLISSQLPAGTTAALADKFQKEFPGKQVDFYYSPENLVLGRAIQAFSKPARVVIGVVHTERREKLSTVMKPFCENILWMSLESAEMTKHALNAYLATCVAFINEIAVLCEKVGADAADVERGLRSDPRIGQKAYLKPGNAFSGGTLGRDVAFLRKLAAEKKLPVALLEGVSASNQNHQMWVRKKLSEWLPVLTGRTIAVLGLTYKPGTDTLRRSAAVELCRWLHSQQVKVVAYDPMVKSLPEELKTCIRLADSPTAAFRAADAVVIATEWEDFKNLKAEEVLSTASRALVLDPNGFLKDNFGTHEKIRYLNVGKPL